MFGIRTTGTHQNVMVKIRHQNLMPFRALNFFQRPFPPGLVGKMRRTAGMIARPDFMPQFMLLVNRPAGIRQLPVADQQRFIQRADMEQRHQIRPAKSHPDRLILQHAELEHRAFLRQIQGAWRFQ